MRLSDARIDDTHSDIGFHTTTIVESARVDSSLKLEEILHLKEISRKPYGLSNLLMGLAVSPVKMYSAALAASRPVR